MNIVDSAPGHDARAVQIGTGYLLTAQAGRSAQHRAAVRSRATTTRAC
nr:hypothetical protein [Burkholderia ubonensis]